MNNYESELWRENQRLQRQNQKLRRAITVILNYAITERQQAAALLSQKSGVPRSQWVFAKGVYRVAEGVLALLR